MTNWGFDENDDNNGLDNNSELNGPKALREYVKKLQAQNDELNQKLTSFLEDQQKSKMASVFENLGIPQAASVYDGPADPEKAKAWAETMKSVFGGNQGGTPTVADNAEQAPQPGAIPPSMQAQFQRMVEAGTDGSPVGNFEAAANDIGNASNPQDIIAAFQRMNRM